MRGEAGVYAARFSVTPLRLAMKAVRRVPRAHGICGASALDAATTDLTKRLWVFMSALLGMSWSLVDHCFQLEISLVSKWGRDAAGLVRFEENRETNLRYSRKSLVYREIEAIRRP